MGLIATLFKLTGAKLDTKGNSPGQSVIATAEGFDEQTLKPEIYQAPGVLAIPGDGSRGVWVPIGGSNRYGVVIAMQNYALNIQINQGETAVYSTTADGQTVKALIKLKVDGTIEFNGDSKRLVTWSELNTALQNHVHSAGSGTLLSPAGPCTGSTGKPVALDISAAKTTTLKTGG